MRIKSIRDVRILSGKTVLLRADFNVPFHDGKILEDYKIIAGLPTVKYLLKNGCSVAIATHLGDPGGKQIKKLSVAPIAERLGELTGTKIRFINDCQGPAVTNALKVMKPGEIAVLENVRFYKGEEENEPAFARVLAAPFDLAVNDAFGVSHRAHASVSAIKKCTDVYAGLLLEKELLNLQKAFEPVKPLVVIIGGAKISTKLPLIDTFSAKADQILVGGAIANDFLKALGYEVGKSLVSDDDRSIPSIVKLYKRLGNKKIILPFDFVVSDKKDGGHASIRKLDDVKRDDIILDLGPKTIGFYAKFIKLAGTLVWNGPMGYFENEHFKHATIAIARLVASRSGGKAFGVVGGGETIEALRLTKMAEHIDWISTGGGAMLEYLSGKKLPGLEGLVK